MITKEGTITIGERGDITYDGFETAPGTTAGMLAEHITRRIQDALMAYRNTLRLAKLNRS